MDEDASLETYFDQSIAGSSEYMFGGDLEGPPQLQDPSFLSSSISNQQKNEDDDLDLSFLPDELNVQDEGGENTGVGLTEDSGVFPDCSTARPPEADTEVNTRQPAASPFCFLPMTPMTPVAHVAESSGIIPQLQNIVSTVNLACPLDLKAIALQARKTKYNPKRFAAVIMRIRESKTTALIFSSGKMVCTGAKSEEQSHLAARKYVRVVRKLGFPAKFLDFKIVNIVSSCDVCFPIRLECLELAHKQFSSYEPELFPCLIYRMVKPRIVLKIFESGKVVLTGAKDRSEIYEAFENIYPILKAFRKQNIVSTVNLACPLDLKAIALQARNAEYNPKCFAALIMRIREPRTTALIFSSGKMVCTGAKSEEQSRLAARKYARVVQKLGFPAKFLDFKIQNMVGSCDVCFPIWLEGLVLTHQQFSSYEPELFPGLIYRMVKPRIVLKIFVSGKVVLTGAKDRSEIYEAFENIYPILKAFRKQ